MSDAHHSCAGGAALHASGKHIFRFPQPQKKSNPYKLCTSDSLNVMEACYATTTAGRNTSAFGTLNDG